MVYYREKFLAFLLCFLLFVGSTVSVAQTNPAPWNLTTLGSYIFNNWASANIAGAYPPSSFWHRTSTLHPPLAAATTGNYAGAYNAVAGTARIEGLNAAGFNFCNDITASDHNLGAFVVGLNSVGRTNITVNWTAQGTSAGSLYNVRLQYRISISSP